MIRFIRFSFVMVVLSACMVANGFTESKSFQYRLNVRIDPAQHQVKAEVWIDNPPETRFYLQPGFTIRQILAEGVEIPFHKDSSPDSSLLRFAGVHYRIDTKNIGQLYMRYDGAIPEIINGVNMITPELVELALYSVWYPLFEGMRNFTFEMKIDLPKGFLTITNGVLKKERTAEDRTITTWESFKPGFDMALLASPILKKIGIRGRDARIEMYYHDLPEQWVKAHLDSLAAGMDYLNRIYGSPQVKGVLRFIYSPRGGWGYARIPIFVVSENYIREEMKKEFGEARAFHGMCHEMSHFWWTLANTGSPDDWINEGLAEFSAYRLSERRFGKTFGDVLIQEYSEHAANSQTPDCIAETESSSSDRYRNRYEKTTLMFIEARDRFGEASLNRLLKHLHTRFAGTYDATTDRFLEEAEKQMGSEAQEFFREYLYRTWEVKPLSK
ncbi:hypothetical protein LLG96_15805 [bacterium]|nr:hypothetical protein [bacterium]